MVTGKNTYCVIYKIVTWVQMILFLIGGIGTFVFMMVLEQPLLGVGLMFGVWIIGFLCCLNFWFMAETADNIAGTTDNLVMISNQLAEISDKMNREAETNQRQSKGEMNPRRIVPIENAVVEAVSGSLIGQKVSLAPNQIITIGRDPSCCQFVLPASGISRKHCTIFYNGMTGHLAVTDYSTNGTYINGSRIGSGIPVEAKIGTKITLGRTNETFALR